MTALTVDVRGVEVLSALRNGNKRIAFAVVNALNKTIREVQVAEQDAAFRQFTVRRSEFVKRQVAVISNKAGGFARVATGRFEARVQVGEKPRLLLSAFERGGSRTSAILASGATMKGKRAAVPVIGGPARPGFAATVPEAFTFKGLQLRRDPRNTLSKKKRKSRVTFMAHVTKAGVVQFKGRQRTFVLFETNRAPEGGVFQRIGPGRGDIRMVYSFKQGQSLEKRLGFEPRALKVATARFPVILQSEVQSSLAFAAARVFK